MQKIMVVSFFSDGWLDLGVELGGCNLEYLPEAASRCHVYRFVCYLYSLKSMGKTTVEPSLSKKKDESFPFFSSNLRYYSCFFFCFGAYCLKYNTRWMPKNNNRRQSFRRQVSQCKKAAMEGQEATDEDDVVRILILGQKDAMTLWR